MANEIQQQFITGKTVYATVTRADGEVWRTDTSVFEARSSSDWAHYAIATSEAGATGYYVGSFPTGITAAGSYNVQFWAQAGGSPGVTDLNNGMLGGVIYWTGSAEAFALASSAANAANAAMNGQNLAANIVQVAGQNASAVGAVTFPGSIGTSTFAAGGNVNVTQIAGQTASASAPVTFPGSIGTSTLTQTQVTGGSYALSTNLSGQVNTVPNQAVNVAQWNGSAVSLSGGLPNVSGGGGGIDSGPIPVNQNTGGTDNLRYVDESGNGVGDANVFVYLATDWPANPSAVQATAITGPDGRWLAPAFVQSGTYVAVFTKLGADGPDVSAAFTV
jgi:hypothetical protein